MLVLAVAVNGAALGLILWQAKRIGLQPYYQPSARPVAPTGVPPAPIYPLTSTRRRSPLPIGNSFRNSGVLARS